MLWGLFAPRSHWRSLTGWSVSDPHASEPGAAAYGVRRLVSGIGTLALAGVLILAVSSFVTNLPKPAPPLSAVHIMWGAPDPLVVNRVVTSASGPPVDLPQMPVLGYQAFTNSGAPSYLTRLRTFTLLGDGNAPGYIGSTPDTGLAAIDTASLVVNVRGPVLCIPRQAVIIETETTIQIGVFYGLPDRADGAAIDQLASCPADSTLTASLLIPIDLANPVGDRKVQTLDGQDIDGVRIVTDD